MSIANPAVEYPAKKKIEFKSSAKCFLYYDKDEKKNVLVPLPFEFIVIDEFACITGYHESSSSGIWSNEVKNTKTEPLTVKAFKGGQIAEGLYQDIKDTVKSQGGKYTKSLYIMYDGELCNLKLSGAGFSGYEDKNKVTHGGWIMAGKLDSTKKKIVVNTTIEGKKGTNVYDVPLFEQGDAITTSEKDEALDALALLKEYSQAKRSQKLNKEEVEQEVSTNDSSELVSAAQDMFEDKSLKADNPPF